MLHCGVTCGTHGRAWDWLVCRGLPRMAHMGTLYLVRHAQASFGEADYDRLSPLGERQSRRLGEYFAARGQRFDAVLTGTLRRHAQTLAGIADGMGQALPALEWPGLNEYDSEAVIATVHPHPLRKPQSPDEVRAHFRLLRDGLAQWMAGVVTPRGMPGYDDFVAGVRGALDWVRQQHHGRQVLLVSSGGPIATAVGLVLGLSPEATIELNLRIRNSSVTEFVFNPRRHQLLTYNTLPHLDGTAWADWVTFA